MNAFLSFFGKIGSAFSSPKLAADAQVAGTVLSAFNPGLGSVVESIANVVYTVESSVGSASGATKKATAQSILDTAAPSILQVLSAVTGKTVDATAASSAISHLIDDVVTVLNDLNVFTHKSAPAPAPAAAAPTPAS